jgi:anaerobic selenocysteine-containing dehydrogenase
VLERGTQQAAAAGAAVLKSVCRACHGGCGVLLHVEDGRLTKVAGDPSSPLNRGRLCPIGTRTLDLVYHPDRLKHPLRRTGPRGGGQWQRVGWDEALDEIAGRLTAIKRAHGPEAIALGTGTGRHHIRWVSRFGHALGTPNWCEPGFAQCFHPRINTTLLTFGDFPVCDFTGDVAPECIVYWGHNPVNSGPDGETRFNALDSLAGNPKIIVVDPRRTRLAKMADVWLPLRPGTDDALALALLNVLIAERLYDEAFVAKWTHGFDALAERVRPHTPEWAEPITWVPADRIRAAARLYAATRPSMMEWGCAIEHTPNCRAHREHRRARRLGVRHARHRALPQPDREPHARGEREASRRRPFQDAVRRGRGPSRRAHPDAAQGDARRRAVSGQGVPRLRQQHAHHLR